MVARSWGLNFEHGQYTVEVEYQPRSCKRTIRVNGVVVARQDEGLLLPFLESDLPFALSDHHCCVRTTTNGFTTRHDLIIDGVSVKTGQPVAPSLPVPGWTWAFVAVSATLLLVGGLLGALCALPAVLLYPKFARSKEDSTAMRVALCGGTAFASWSAYVLIIVLLGSTLGGLSNGVLGRTAPSDFTPRDPANLHGTGKVYLVPLGTFPRGTAEALERYYETKYVLPVEVLAPLAVPPSARNIGRDQVIAEELTGLLQAGYPQLAAEPDAVLIGLTDEDLYIRQASWRFAFSYRQGNRYAVVSSARMQLAVPASDPTLPLSRLRKMVTKDIGVMHYRLPLSDNPRSVLYDRIGGLEELDAMGEEY